MESPTFRLCLAAIGVAGLAGCAGTGGTGGADSASTSMSSSASSATPGIALDPAALPRIGTIDPRYQSYNVEMLEVTGGNFWKPYADIGKPGAGPKPGGGEVPAGMDPGLYQYRPPIDLTNPRLRMLAKALAPAYVRVSGTWANSTYFSTVDPPPDKPPKGYGGVLTATQWSGLVAFSQAVDARIVSSVPTSAGTRNAQGQWTPEQTRRWLEFTRAAGGQMAALEFMNEPTFAAMGGAPAGYDAAAYGRDYKVFHDFLRKESPQTKIIGPGSVGEAEADWAVARGGYGRMQVLAAPDLAAVSGNTIDGFSYHHYGAVSQRCAAMGQQFQIGADQVLSEDWLGRTDVTLAYYRQVRDRYMPGKRFWNTETADAACGGNPWGGQFLDTFRYLDQLGRLARQETEVVLHNTLVASDYGILDENDFTPKPNYWGALLWRRLMGTTVLDAGIPVQMGRHVYAHCLRGQQGGVALLIINNDTQNATTLDLGTAGRGGQQYALTSPQLQSRTVLLNGQELALGTGDRLPAMSGQAIGSGPLVVAPASISFVALPGAANPACNAF